MNKLTRTGMLFGVLLVGCATGGVASRLVVPPVLAATNPQRWQYKCFKNDDPERVEKIADQLGGHGFELGSAALAGGHDMSSPIWYFKRPY